MSRTDHRFEILDGQTDFRGGMQLVGDAGENEYRYATNIVTRRGWIETRPGMRRTSRAFNEGFYFNEENAKFNDATHTGFWFPWDWINLDLGVIQGATFFRFLADTDVRQIVVGGGKVYVFTNGYVEEIATFEALGTDESIEFIQADQWLVMLRDEGDEPMRWDGSNAGFTAFTSAGTSNRIPLSSTGTYAGGRLWLVKDRDNIFASDIFDIDNYDYVDQQFAVRKGDGDEITRLVPYHDDYLLVFKKRRVYALSGITYAGQALATGAPDLSEVVTSRQVFNNFGLVAPKAVVVHGEQVTFLSYRGIASISRTTEGQLQGVDVTLSAPIQPIIDRINWRAVEGACAGAHDNYLLFAVPLDNSAINNAVIVYDLETKSWVSVWDGELISPTDFFNDEETLVVLNSDGAFREWFTNDPWDSNTPFLDVELYDATKLYAIDNLVLQGSDTLFRALVENVGVPLTDSTTWSLIADPQNLHRINSEIKTRFFKHNDEASPKRFSRAQMIFRHQNPNIDIDIEDREHGTTQSLFDDVQYSRVEYEVDNKADWESDNTNLDMDDPGREDYTAFIDTDDTGTVISPAVGDGLTVDATIGFTLNINTTHDLRFVPRVSNNTEFALTVRNTQGSFRVISILSKAQQGQLAKRNV